MKAIEAAKGSNFDFSLNDAIKAIEPSKDSSIYGAVESAKDIASTLSGTAKAIYDVLPES